MRGGPSGHQSLVWIMIPRSALVVLVGAAACGKSTFAARHFRPTQVVSSDYCRALVSDDENNQAASRDAFDVAHLIIAKRLHRGRLTVVDATNASPAARKPLIRMAETHGLPAVAIVFDLPEDVCVERNAGRPRRGITRAVIHRHATRVRRSLLGLDREGFQQVFVLRTPEAIDDARIRSLA